MSDFRKLRSNAEQTRAELEAELHRLRSAAGEALLETHPDTVESTLYDREAELTEHIRATAATRERAVQLRDRIAELSARRDDAEAEYKRLTHDLEPLYAPVGSRAFVIYRDNPLVDQEYAEIFTPLVAVLEQVRESRREVESLEAELEDKPFIEKVIVRGRLALARNRLATHEGRLQKLEVGAGKQILATDFVAAIGDPSLDAAAAPYNERIDSIERIERELSSLADEIESLRGKLRDICDGKPAGQCIASLEDELDAITRNRQEVLALIAEATETGADDDAIAAMPAAARDAVNACRAISERIADHGGLIERLDAAIRVERLDQEIRALSDSIDRKQLQIDALTGDIAELDERRRASQSEKAAAEAVRGDSSTLGG